MHRRKVKELERQAMLWGYDPKKVDKAKEKMKMAEKWLKDPLYGFPNDIEYLKRPDIEAKIGISKRFWHKMKPEARWDRERGRACIGYMGAVARRCSMNDKLWDLYRKSVVRGVPFTLADVRKMIAIDIKRSKLYPPGWQDDSTNPPQWYLDKLRADGSLDQIFKEIDEATRA